MEYTTEFFTTDAADGIFSKTVNINDTIDTNATSTQTTLLLYDYLIPTIGSVIILVNLVVVISSGLILRNGQEPRSTYLFLGNVAMTDLITGIAVVFGQAYPKAKRDHYLCAVQLGMIVSSTLTSVYSVGLIAVDRFLYILHGMQYQSWVYPTRARLLICLAWTIGIIVGFLPLMGWYGDTNNGQICWFILLAPKGLVLITVLLGILPIILVLFLYSIILYHALRKIVQLQRQSRNRNNVDIEEDPSSGNIRMFRGGSNNAENPEEINTRKKGILSLFKKKPSASVKSPNKWKAIKVVLFTTGSFLITWSPYFIASVIYVFSCDIDDATKKCKTIRTLIASPLAILGFMNSFLNPIIYAWWHKGFRTFFKKKVDTIVMRTTRDYMINSASQSKSTESSKGESKMSRRESDNNSV
ncbi:hypothetical protein NQ315_007019 [Exocentrus adspersus]|uniref:G-protein coupled receptors family 1 profile domain-containing protein n=1 Tax=Exocentrus adspersus TaxID=1586481 RepID=A0AAV8WD41_9CUCU|nr:hypothetical protein NQ315_007019 [Exocentrus adspersus]